MTQLEFAWPRDDKRGGKWRRIKDLLLGKGPDVYIRRADGEPKIAIDQWSNWHTYHSRDGIKAGRRAFPCADRNNKYYDPVKRKYVKWHPAQDINRDYAFRPRFTEKEWRKMRRAFASGRGLDPKDMGKEWTTSGPKRWRQEHDHYWRHAHRIGDNRLNGDPKYYPPDRTKNYHQCNDWDLEDWVEEAWRLPRRRRRDRRYF